MQASYSSIQIELRIPNLYSRAFGLILV